MNSYGGPRLAVIGLDGAQPDRLRRYISEGRLPALARLMGQSREVEVQSEGELFWTSVWPCLASGLSVASHGLHAFRPLKSGTMSILEAEDFQLPAPFWEAAARRGVVTTVLDFPFYGPPAADDGLEHLQFVEWGPHPPVRSPGASDSELMPRLLARHGHHPCTADDQSLFTAGELADVVARLRVGARTRSAVVADLVEWTHPDLLVAVFPEIHVAAHQFVNREAADHRCHDPAVMAALGSPTRDVYEAVDRAVGEVLERLPPETTVLLTCVLGVRVNHGASLLLHDLLLRLGITVPSAGVRTRKSLSKLARLLPAPMERALKRGYTAVTQSLSGNRRGGLELDWSKTRAFALPWAYDGYLRVNLRGREPAGIVAPGAEREQLLDQIEAVVSELRLAGTNEPAARSIVRAQEQFPGAANAELPDLMVLWNDYRQYDAVESRTIGRIGNRDRAPRSAHGPGGRMFARGPLIAAGPVIEGARDFDIAPTILGLLGVSAPSGIEGRAVSELFAAGR